MVFVLSNSLLFLSVNNKELSISAINNIVERIRNTTGLHRQTFLKNMIIIRPSTRKTSKVRETEQQSFNIKFKVKKKTVHACIMYIQPCNYVLLFDEGNLTIYTIPDTSRIITEGKFKGKLSREIILSSSRLMLYWEILHLHFKMLKKLFWFGLLQQIQSD